MLKNWNELPEYMRTNEVAPRTGYNKEWGAQCAAV